MDIDKLIYDCIGASMQVYNHLGPGLLETIYEKALKYELIQRGYRVETQVKVDIKIVNFKCIYCKLNIFNST